MGRSRQRPGGGEGRKGLGRSLSGSGLSHGLPPYATATAPPPHHQRRRHTAGSKLHLPPGSHRAARVFKPPPGRAAFGPRGSPREGCAETRTLGTWPWGEGNDLQGPAAVPPPLPPSGERPPAGARPTSAANTSSFQTRGAGVSLSDPALRPRGDTWLGPPARAGTRPGEGGETRLASPTDGAAHPSTRSRLLPPLPPSRRHRGAGERRKRWGAGRVWGKAATAALRAPYPGTPGGRLFSFAAGPSAGRLGEDASPDPEGKGRHSLACPRAAHHLPATPIVLHRSPLPPATRARPQRPGRARARTLPRQHTSPTLRRARAPGPATRRTARPLQPGAGRGRIPPPSSPDRTPAAENCRGDGRAERGWRSAPRLPRRGNAGRRREPAEGEERRGRRRRGGRARPNGQPERRARALQRQAAAAAPAKASHSRRAREERGRAFLRGGTPPARVRRGGEPSPPARRGGSCKEALRLHGRTRGHGRRSARPDSRALRRQPTAVARRVYDHTPGRAPFRARGSDRRRTDAGRGDEGARASQHRRDPAATAAAPEAPVPEAAREERESRAPRRHARGGKGRRGVCPHAGTAPPGHRERGSGAARRARGKGRARAWARSARRGRTPGARSRATQPPGNDPSAGSPTETLLRLLLPLDSQVRPSSRRSGRAGADPAGADPRTSLNHPIGSSDGRCVQRAGT